MHIWLADTQNCPLIRFVHYWNSDCFIWISNLPKKSLLFNLSFFLTSNFSQLEILFPILKFIKFLSIYLLTLQNLFFIISLNFKVNHFLILYFIFIWSLNIVFSFLYYIDYLSFLLVFFRFIKKFDKITLTKLFNLLNFFIFPC